MQLQVGDALLSIEVEGEGVDDMAHVASVDQTEPAPLLSNEEIVGTSGSSKVAHVSCIPSHTGWRPVSLSRPLTFHASQHVCV